MSILKPVTCPCGCQYTFTPPDDIIPPESLRRRRKNGQGAGYALKWVKLPQTTYDFLLWWINNHACDVMGKNQIMKERPDIGQAPLGARVSELVALDLLYWQIIPNTAKPNGAPYNSDHTKYKLNLLRASKVIENGGRLKIE